MVKLGQDLEGSAGCTRQEELFRADQCAGAVADLIFNGVGKFSEGLIVAVGNEEWVVAETAAATRLERYRSIANAFGDVQYFTAGCRYCHDSDKACATVCISGFRELEEK